MQEEFVQAVWTVHTYILTCVWDNRFYIRSYCTYHLYILTYVCLYVCLYVCTYVRMYVCMYSQHCLYKLGQHVLYIWSYCIILTVLCGIPMYNIVWAMLTVWDNWFLK